MYAPLDNSEPCCESCRHFRPLESSGQDEDGEYKFTHAIEEGEYGKCTRYPPRFFYPQLLNAEFPVVRHNNHCGEYSRRTY